MWTLDALFLLPKGRLKYYKKLYSRLLKSTTPGRSDHKLLLVALDKLDNLMSTLEARESIQVSTLSSAASPPITEHPEDEVVIDLRTQSIIGKSAERAPSLGGKADSLRVDSLSSPVDNVLGSASSSTRASSQGSTNG